MKQCRECGTLSPDDTVFCYICGTKFAENDVKEKNISLESDGTNNGREFIVDPMHDSESMLSALKTNGVYYFIEGEVRYLLRFNPDGTVLGTSEMNNSIPTVAEVNSKSYRDQGRYLIEDGQISFSLINQNGQVDYWGQVSKGALTLSSYSHINGYQASNKVYYFVEL